MPYPLPNRLWSLVFCVLCLAVLSGCGASAASRDLAAAPPARAAPIKPQVATGAAPGTGGPVARDTTRSADGGQRPSSPAEASETKGRKFPRPYAASRSAQETAASRAASGLKGEYRAPAGGKVSDCWLPLVQRLQADPKVTPEVVNYFCSLPEYSAQPMGVKIKELFTSAFLRKKRVPGDGKAKPPPSRIYRNIVTPDTMRKCESFLARHEKVFDAVAKKYPVPREVLAALLFVETRLGTHVGKNNAFWSLACMAAADSPERVQGGLGDIPIAGRHAGWLQARLTDKSDWAYKELRALLAFCAINRLDPHSMPGSVYGAIGICQFMPSNLVPYGEDGDGDGVINLFSEPDAIFSAARYLTRHGWKQTMTADAERGVLKRYNNLNVYANTILALAEALRTGHVQTGPPATALTRKF
jgi:membrane-bound lytic murein transglycosylase B